MGSQRRSLPPLPFLGKGRLITSLTLPIVAGMLLVSAGVSFAQNEAPADSARETVSTPATPTGSSVSFLAGIEDELRLECGHIDLRVDWSITESMQVRLASLIDAEVTRVQGDGCSDRVVVQVSGGDGKSTNRYLVSGDVEIWGSGLRAARTLRPGTLLSFEDVTEGEGWFPPSAYGEPITSAEGSYLVRGVAAGKVISKGDLSAPPLVRRGETVRVIYRGPGLELRTLGTVRKDGWMGDRLEVRADGAKHDCTGIVSGPDVVEVDSNQGRQR